MKSTPLTRLIAHARKDKAFVKLLREDRKAALKQAAESGIKLSSKEDKLLESVLSGDQVHFDVRPGRNGLVTAGANAIQGEATVLADLLFLAGRLETRRETHFLQGSWLGFEASQAVTPRRRH